MEIKGVIRILEIMVLVLLISEGGAEGRLLILEGGAVGRLLILEGDAEGRPLIAISPQLNVMHFPEYVFQFSLKFCYILSTYVLALLGNTTEKRSNDDPGEAS